MRFISGVVCVLLLNANFGDSTKLPSFIKPCKLNAELSKCVLEEGRRVMKRFTEGIPELNVDSLDPLVVGDIGASHGPIGINYKQYNVIIKGFKNSQLLDLRFDVEKKTGHSHLIGNITSRANYSVDGQLLVFPIKGRGESVTRIWDFDMKMDWTWEVYRAEDGKEYTRMTGYKTNIDYGRTTFKFTGLFDNDKILRDTFNQFLNANSKDIMKELGGPTVKLVEKRVNGIFNNFFSRIPYEDLIEK